MVKGMLLAAMILFAVSIGIVLYSIIRGPSTPDRVISLDFIGINLISIIAVVSVFFHTRAFLEVILILGILAFISTIAFSRFIERGAVIEHKRDK